MAESAEQLTVEVPTWEVLILLILCVTTCYNRFLLNTGSSHVFRVTCFLLSRYTSNLNCSELGTAKIVIQLMLTKKLWCVH